MSHKINSICMKVMIISCFMLLLQGLKAQYNFSSFDAVLDRNKKVLGNNFVALVWKDTMVHKKEIGEFNIAGRILEIVSKRRVDVLVRQKLFVPLGMRRTTFSDMNGGVVDPANGAQSTGDDYIRFLAMMLNKGKLGDKQILSEKSVGE